MARKPKAKPAGTSRWQLADCPTNARVWDPEWESTRGHTQWARRGSLVALNAFGTVRLFDVADPHDVRVLGSLAVPVRGGMLEDLAIGFDREGRVVQTSADELFVVDVSDPMAPRLAESRPIAPPFRSGGFVDGVLYRSAKDSPGVFAHDGATVTPLLPELKPFMAPHAYARVGDFLYVFAASEEVLVLRHGDLAQVRAKRCDVNFNARIHHVPELQLVVAISGAAVQILDVATPANPKVQKRIFKHTAMGGGIAGDLLYLVDGDYQEPQALTTIRLGRPASTVIAREPFTTDPELGSGLLFLEPRGNELFLLTTTARFAVLLDTNSLD